VRRLLLAPRAAARTAARTADYGLLTLCATLAAAGAPQALLSAALLATEGRLLTLHAWPLAPLLADVSEDVVFMETYTTPGFFSSELLLIFLLATAPGSAVAERAPVTLLSAHAAAHALYALVSTVAPQWAVQQNTTRMNRTSPRSQWSHVLNVLNAADLATHAAYAGWLAAALPPPAALLAAAAGAGLTAGGLRRASAARAHLLAEQPLKGRVAVVTGAGGGVGSALCALLKELGATVVGITRGDSGGRGGVACDLADAAAVRAAAAAVAAAHPCGVHLLVCCAAVAPWGGEDASQAVRECWKVNLLGHASLAAALLPSLAAAAAAARPGKASRVILVSSDAGAWPGARAAMAALLRPPAAAAASPALTGVPPYAAYAASKRALAALARAAAPDMLPQGVLVLAVHPGLAPSRLQRHMGVLGFALNAALTACGYSAEQAAGELVAAALHPLAASDSGGYMSDGKLRPRLCQEAVEDEQAVAGIWAAAKSEASSVG
jgi:NAD(P)-dependent dehydrogenase (short-subunit alcohol dehydrogenase family)